MFLLPFLMALLAARGEARRFLPLFLACNAGILLMPPAMWQENYGWVSGFGNYVVSALFFLAWLLLLRRTADSRTHLVRRAVLLFFLSLACGLFVENLTALFLGASLILAVYTPLRDRALRPPFWACLAGSALAALLMFGNGMFSDLASTGSAPQRAAGADLLPGGRAAGDLLQHPELVCGPSAAHRLSPGDPPWRCPWR